jgi:hypothetical protein
MIEQLIANLNLDDIKEKILSSHGKLWKLTHNVDKMVKEYRKFLLDVAKNTNKEIVPSKNADVIWHQHILFTQKYAEDCEKIFGTFIHHCPKVKAKEACCYDQAGACGSLRHVKSKPKLKTACCQCAEGCNSSNCSGYPAVAVKQKGYA